MAELTKQDKELTAQLLRDRLAPVRDYKVMVDGSVLKDSQVVIDIGKREVQISSSGLPGAKK